MNVFKITHSYSSPDEAKWLQSSMSFIEMWNHLKILQNITWDIDCSHDFTEDDAVFIMSKFFDAKIINQDAKNPVPEEYHEIDLFESWEHGYLDDDNNYISRAATDEMFDKYNFYKHGLYSAMLSKFLEQGSFAAYDVGYEDPVLMDTAVWEVLLQEGVYDRAKFLAEQKSRPDFVANYEIQLKRLAEINTVGFDISFEIVTFLSGKFGISGHIAIDDVLINFPDYDDDHEYETQHDAELAAQKHYSKFLIKFVSNKTLHENVIRPLPFDGGYVDFGISMFIVPHLDNFKMVGRLRQYKGGEEYLILDQFDSIELGYSEYNSPAQARKSSTDLLKHVIANNLIFSCNKCAHATKHPFNEAKSFYTLCNNKSSELYSCVMDGVADGCDSFQSIEVTEYFEQEIIKFAPYGAGQGG